MYSLFGDQKGASAPLVPSIGRAASLSSERIHSCRLPLESLATNASVRPSGDNTAPSASTCPGGSTSRKRIGAGSSAIARCVWNFGISNATTIPAANAAAAQYQRRDDVSVAIDAA